jgi:pullulanase
MKRSARGTWSLALPGVPKNLYYTYRVSVCGELREAVDPYARATGANGRRGQIVDLRETDPSGWAQDRRPPCRLPTEAVIYELHVRDATIHPASGVRHRGKYLGLAEKPLISHLQRLGVTHVHLLPMQDFESVDETRPDGRYNWGYDPQNYNVPEGSYATDAHDGRVRIREFKRAVLGLHRAGIGVVMDVVYNHTFRAGDSAFNRIVPDYYYRARPDGSFSNGSGCGNETASERPMFRKFMIDSLLYWAREYHVDGFRFDLMGLHDLETMRRIRAVLDRVDPSILLYGEGWTGGDSPLANGKRAMKTDVRRLRGIAAFNDGLRDALKGPVSEHGKPGFVSGADSVEEALKAGIVAAVAHPDVSYPAGNDWHGPWAGEPWRCISYDSCHDNHTLWDRLRLGAPSASEAARIRMNKLCAAILMTSQGICFLHAGEEFLRTKNGEENSYNKPDAVNRLDWVRARKYRGVTAYYQGLIAIRRAYPELRLRSAAEIRAKLRFLPMPAARMVGFHVGRLVVIHNARSERMSVKLPGAGWQVLADAAAAGINAARKVAGETVDVPRISSLVLERIARR